MDKNDEHPLNIITDLGREFKPKRNDIKTFLFYLKEWHSVNESY